MRRLIVEIARAALRSLDSIEQRGLREDAPRIVRRLASNPAFLQQGRATYREIIRRYEHGRTTSTRASEESRRVVFARATRCLRLIDLFVPRRLRDEEIGDALEVIHRLVVNGEPGWQRDVRIKVISTSFWVLVNAFRDLAAGIFGKKSA